MVRKTGIEPVLLESDYETASCCSEVAVWKEQNLSSQKHILEKSCSAQFLAGQLMKQSSLQDCLLASEDFTVSHRAYQQWSGSRKSIFGSHRQRKRRLSHHNLQQHWNSNHFSRLGLSLVLLLLVFSTSSLGHNIPWDTWSIEDLSTPGNMSQEYYGSAGALSVPDLLAIAGHLFEYQVATSLFHYHRSSLHFQV